MKLSKKRKLEELARRKEKLESIKPVNGANLIFCVLGSIGIVCILLGINLYRLTFIHPLILLLVVLMIGLLGYRFSNILLVKLYKKSYSWVYTYLFSLTFFGGICYYVFLKVNYQSAEKETAFESTLMIEKVGKLGGKNHLPYVIVTHNGLEKYIVFTSSTFKENPKALKLMMGKGLFGFDVIKEKELLQ